MGEKLSEGPSSQETNKSGGPRIKFVDLNFNEKTGFSINLDIHHSKVSSSDFFSTHVEDLKYFNR